MEKNVLTLIVANRFGVLTKVTSLFGRRACNIEHLTAEPGRDPRFTDITIRVAGQTEKVRQIYHQLHKLEDVAEVSLRAEPPESAS